MRLLYGDSVVVECWRQILHRQRVLSILGRFLVLVVLVVAAAAATSSTARCRCIIRASLAVLQRIVGHIGDELLRGDGDQPDTERRGNL